MLQQRMRFGNKLMRKIMKILFESNIEFLADSVQAKVSRIQYL